MRDGVKLMCPLCRTGEVGFAAHGTEFALGLEWRLRCHLCKVDHPHLQAARKAILAGEGFTLSLLARLPGKAFEHTIDQLTEEFPTLRVFHKPAGEDPF
jgi:hypothetical protein